LDVLKGVTEAQNDPEIGKPVVPINPEHAKIDPSFGLATHDKAMWSVMKFDVAITALPKFIALWRLHQPKRRLLRR